MIVNQTTVELKCNFDLRTNFLSQSPLLVIALPFVLMRIRFHNEVVAANGAGLASIVML